MSDQTQQATATPTGAASVLDDELGTLRSIGFAAEALRAHIVFHGEVNTKDSVFLDFNEAVLAWGVWREPRDKTYRRGEGPGWCD